MEGPKLASDGPAEKMVQWGHGVYAVEGADPTGTYNNILVLQWGHGVYAVEGWTAPATSTCLTSLQWGHGVYAVEGMAMEQYMNAYNSFNGATAFTPWKESARNRPSQQHLRLALRAMPI